MTSILGKRKRSASISLNLDNQWSYMKAHGDAGWESYPSYLDLFVPRVLDFFEDRGLKITVFIVGQDAALDKNRSALVQITERGHTVGNHSFHHDPGLHLCSESAIDEELAHAEEAIHRATGAQPRGFRGPGFHVSEATLRVLCRRHYDYDASTLATFFGPLARARDLLTSSLSKEQRDKRRRLFGTLSDGFLPNRPYRWQVGRGFLEIPVTTMPMLRLPIHFSYLLYLQAFSSALARTYFSVALELCRASGAEPSLVLHPLDFLGGDDVRALSGYPGMSMSGAEKVAAMSRFMSVMTGWFDVLSLDEYARQISSRSVRVLEPRFEPELADPTTDAMAPL